MVKIIALYLVFVIVNVLAAPSDDKGANTS